MKSKINVGISSCLLGEKVRYDGGHKLDHYLRDTLSRYIQWFPVCPEVECGLPVPLDAMHLEGDPASPRLVTRVSKIDYTPAMKTWAKKRLKELERNDICGFIFKSKSPSSGLHGVKVRTPSGRQSTSGTGIFAQAFTSKFPTVPVEDDRRLHDPQIRENFIEMIYVYSRWKDFLLKGAKASDLIAFHTNHKLLLMSHSPKHYSSLNRLITRPGKINKKFLHQYIQVFMEGLKLTATLKKNTNVLMHIMGYFKTKLAPEEKEALLDSIHKYHKGLVPLIAPITLINYFARKFNNLYLTRQYYLNPTPYSSFESMSNI